MTPTRWKIHAAFVGFALLLAGCGPTKPPQDDLDAASRGLATAREAGAATYAPLELRFAGERLDQAQAAVAKGDYDVADRLAQESAVNSELATVKVRLGKAREAMDKLKQANAELAKDLPADAGGGQP